MCRESHNDISNVGKPLAKIRVVGVRERRRIVGEEEMECCQYNEDGSMFGNELYYNTCDHNCEEGSMQVQLAYSIAIAVGSFMLM